MRNSNVSERLKYLIQTFGYKQIDIVNKAQSQAEHFNKLNKTKIKFGRNDISQYVSGKVEPNQYKLDCLAKALNVSPVWLMGYDVPMEQETIEEEKREFKYTKDNIDTIVKDILDKIEHNEISDKKELLDQLAWKLEKESRKIDE